LLSLDLKDGNIVTLDSQLHNSELALAPGGAQYAVLRADGELSLKEIGNLHQTSFATMPPRREWPNEYTISYSTDGSQLIVYWFGQLLLYTLPSLRSPVFIEDSSEWGEPDPLGATVFLSRGPRKISLLIDLKNGSLSKIQPESFYTRCKWSNTAPKNQYVYPVDGGIVRNEYLLERYEITTTGIPYEGGTREGIDTLLITPIQNPERRWGIALDPADELFDIPNARDALLIRGGNRIRILDLKTRRVEEF
jgi:hypothetical protein